MERQRNCTNNQYGGKAYDNAEYKKEDMWKEVKR